MIKLPLKLFWIPLIGLGLILMFSIIIWAVFLLVLGASVLLIIDKKQAVSFYQRFGATKRKKLQHDETKINQHFILGKPINTLKIRKVNK